MKKITLFLFILTGFAQAQIVNIPDANFKAKLLSATANNEVAEDLSGNYFAIDVNNDGEIQVSEALEVLTLNLSSSSISDLTGIGAFSNLELFSCHQNDLTSIDMSQNLNLTWLGCGLNQLINLNVTQNINLETIACSQNELANIDVTQNINLRSLYCGFNNLTSLDITQNVNLETIFCYVNEIASLDTSQNVNLTTLNCFSNQLTTIDVTENIYLEKLYSNNNDLETIFMKNGIIETPGQINILNNPNLRYICADEEQIVDMQILGGPNVVVNSYCSFMPEGNYNTISGTIVFDANTNGCDVADLPQSNIRLNINDGTNLGATFTNTNGEYTFFTQEGDFEIAPNVENPSLFNITPATINVTFTDANNNQSSQNYCVIANGVNNDLEVVMVPIITSRPGFDATYEVVYRNKGNQMLSGDVELVFDDAVLDFVTATTNPDLQTVGNLTWNYADFLPFESRSFRVVFNVNTPMETPPIDNGDILNFTASINPISNDETPVDNSFDLNQTVVGSYDPNDITCLEGDIVSPDKIGAYLHYNINFENTGTAAATFVVLKDVIDETQFDVASMQVLNASHTTTTRINDNIIEFIFDDINLDPNQRGNVVFKIKTKNTLVTGDAVNHKAEIYFDYNFPIETNEAITAFESLSVDEFNSDKAVVFYPNPVQDRLHVKSNDFMLSAHVIDVHGRIVQEISVNNTRILMNLSNLKQGIYFVKVKTFESEFTKKIIKN